MCDLPDSERHSDLLRSLQCCNGSSYMEGLRAVHLCGPRGGLPGSKEACCRGKGGSKAKSSCRCQATFHPHKAHPAHSHEGKSKQLTSWQPLPWALQGWTRVCPNAAALLNLPLSHLNPEGQCHTKCPELNSRTHCWSLETKTKPLQKSLWGPYSMSSTLDLPSEACPVTPGSRDIKNPGPGTETPTPVFLCSRCLSFCSSLACLLHQVLMYYLWLLQSSEKPAVLNRKWHGRGSTGVMKFSSALAIRTAQSRLFLWCHPQHQRIGIQSHSCCIETSQWGWKMEVDYWAKICSS